MLQICIYFYKAATYQHILSSVPLLRVHNLDFLHSSAVFSHLSLSDSQEGGLWK